MICSYEIYVLRHVLEMLRVRVPDNYIGLDIFDSAIQEEIKEYGS